MSDLIHQSDDSPVQQFELPDEAATRALGARLAKAMEPGLTIYLVGDLGAGKTTLVRGLLEALGHKGAVKSPTYTLIEPYTVSNLNLYHFDLYRFTDPEEFIDAGLEEYFSERSVCLVEWPDKGRPFLPAADCEVRLTDQGSGRLARLHGNSLKGRDLMKRIGSAA